MQTSGMTKISRGGIFVQGVFRFFGKGGNIPVPKTMTKLEKEEARVRHNMLNREQ